MRRKEIIIDVKEKKSFMAILEAGWNIVSRYVLLLLNIGIVIAVIFLFRWAGLKGLVMFLLGLAIMAFLLLSKNPILKWAIDMTKSEWFINEVKDKDEQKEKV